MTPERFRRVGELFDAAVELVPERRAAFLDAECAGDPALRRLVLERLAAHDQAGGFLESPVVSRAAELLAGAAATGSGASSAPTGDDSSSAPTETQGRHGQAAPGGRIGPYFVSRQIGEGGMGEVWLAEQREPIRRKVALKVIKRGLDTKQVVARFDAERQALALMNHPCLARVYDAGSTADGRPYFAMEYVQGLPINEYCDRHRLNVRGRLRLFTQVCEGVQHAHHQSVLHRDLKPSNVLVTMQEGHAVPKIIDFGIAKATAQPLTDRTLQTELGVLVGTPEYMSPEQAETTAEDLDGRTDVYSLGVMLYELLTGTLPFDPKTLRGKGIQEMRRLIREVDPPKPTARLLTLEDKASTESARHRGAEPSTLRRQLSRDLDWVTMKALAKDAFRRYDSPAALAADIDRFLAGQPVDAGPPGATYRIRKFVRRHASAVGIAAVLTAVVAGGVWWWFAVPTPAPVDSLAILPLENKDADPESEYLVDGITETIINKVSQLPSVRVICRKSAFHYKGPDVDPRKAARELNVRAVLTGSLQRRGQDLVVSAELVDYQNNQQLWGDRFTTSEAKVLEVEERIAEGISERMGQRLSPETKHRVMKQPTESPEAHTFYLKGRHVLANKWGTKAGAQEAIDLFKRAIEADPGYALAYTGLSDTYYSLSNIILAPSEAMPLARAAALKALEQDDTLSGAHVSLGVVEQLFEWNLDAAQREFRRAIDLAPGNADAHLFLGLSLVDTGRTDEALTEIARALEFDPLSPFIRQYGALALLMSRQYGPAESRLKALAAEGSEGQVAHAFLGLVYEQTGRLSEAVDEFRAATQAGESTEARAQLAHALAIAGQRDEASRLLAELEATSKSLYVSPYNLGVVEVALGHLDRAFMWLDRAVQDHSEWLFFLPVDPRLDPVRSDPRFQALLRRVGFTPIAESIAPATSRT